MKKFIIFITVLLVSLSSYAQKNAVYVELFGNGILGSINYERQITKEPKLFARIGLGIWHDLGIFHPSSTGYSIPMSLNYLVDLKNNNYLDLGIGATIVESNFSLQPAPNHVVYLYTSIGFRRNFGTNFFWRFHITPYLDNLTKDTITVGNEHVIVKNNYGVHSAEQWFGISIGKRF